MGFGIEKFNGHLAKAQGKEHLSHLGTRTLEFGTHALVALASKNMEKGIFGVQALKPDWVVLAGALLGTAVKWKGRKSSRSILFGAGHALITRWVSTTSFKLPGSREEPADKGIPPEPFWGGSPP